MSKEVEKFSSLSDDWWNNKEGSFKILHRINGLRAGYILDVIRSNVFDSDKISILDVGCGGGILTEEIAKSGYDITGIDLSKSSIEQARIHSKFSNASYFDLGIEEIADKFDVVMVMEVLEHVENVELFLESCIKSLKNCGLLFFSTINRTKKSFMFAILAAEYILRMLPKGTHNWKKFIQPSELYKIFSRHKMVIDNLKGIEYNLLRDEWYISDNLDVNYVGFASFYA